MTQNDVNASVDWAINNLHGFVAYDGYPGECLSLQKAEFAHRTGKHAPSSGTGYADGYLNRPVPLGDYFNAPVSFDRNKDYPKGSYAFNKPTHHGCIYLGRVGNNASVFEQNADGNGNPAHVFTRDGGRLTHIMTPKVQAPAPPNSGNIGKHITLPPDSGIWHLYHENGPYNIASGQWVTILHPSTSPSGYTYPIVGDKGNGIYVIDSPKWGRGALFTNGSKFSVK